MTRKEIRKAIQMNEISVSKKCRELEPILERRDILDRKYRLAVKNRSRKMMAKLDIKIAALHEHELGPRNARIAWLEGDIKRLQRMLTGN